MRSPVAYLVLVGMVLLSSCTKKESTGPSAEAAKTGAEAPQTAESAIGPRALIHLKSGSTVPGTIVASSRTDMVVAGDDGIEHKIPLGQVKSVEYPDTQTAPPARAPLASARRASPAREEAAPAERKAAERAAQQKEERAADVTPVPAAPSPVAPAPPAATPAAAAPAARTVTTKTYELPAGSEISVRTNEPIDSETAAEGQTFDAQITRDAKDANGDVVIPRRSTARIVIKSASKGGRFRGASDLVLDLESVNIGGRQYAIETVDVTKRGKSGVGANRRTAEYAGGGAALGAIIGAIAGGGKGAAIGAGAGAGAGALTQILTKGRAIKVPAESVLTFNLDKPLKVTQSQ